MVLLTGHAVESPVCAQWDWGIFNVCFCGGRITAYSWKQFKSINDKFRAYGLLDCLFCQIREHLCKALLAL